MRKDVVVPKQKTPTLLIIVAEVNAVGSYDHEPTVSLCEESARVKAKGRRKASDNVEEGYTRRLGELILTREQARWFGERLFRKVRITMEDAGPMESEERELRERDEQMTLEELEADE